MKISEKIRELANISSQTALLLPTVCPSCGLELDINETLTEITCLNPYCIDKLVQRALSFCDFLTIKGFGESFFYQFYQALPNFGVSSLLMLNKDYEEVLSLLEDETDEMDYSASLVNNFKKLANFVEYYENRLTMSEYLRCLGLPHIQSRASAICSDYNNFSELFDDMDSIITIDDLNIMFGFSDGSEISTIKVMETLYTYREEILSYEEAGYTFVSDKAEEGVAQLKVVCSTAVGGVFRSKREFYRHIDAEYNDIVKVTWSDSATKDCDILIWAGADGTPSPVTAKVSKIEKYNRTGSHIPIMTAPEFISLLNGVSDGKTLRDTIDSLNID